MSRSFTLIAMVVTFVLFAACKKSVDGKLPITTTSEDNTTPVELRNYTDNIGGTLQLTGIKGFSPSSGTPTQSPLDTAIVFTVMNDSMLTMGNIEVKCRHSYSGTEPSIDTVNKILRFRSSRSAYSADVDYYYVTDSVRYYVKEYAGKSFNFIEVHSAQ